MKNLFKDIKIEYDLETNQYCIINDLTPGLFGLGTTKEEAIEEYVRGFEDLLKITFIKKYESVAFA